MTTATIISFQRKLQAWPFLISLAATELVTGLSYALH